MALYYSDFVRRLRAPRAARHRVILAFSAIPKVGGTTLENALVSRFKTGVYSFTNHGPAAEGKWRSCRGADCKLLLGHAPLSDMQAKVGPSAASSLVSFMLFREPLSRSLSSYHYYFLSKKNAAKRKPNIFINLLQYLAQPRCAPCLRTSIASAVRLVAHCPTQTYYSPLYTEDDASAVPQVVQRTDALPGGRPLTYLHGGGRRGEAATGDASPAQCDGGWCD